jgi:hypothetical protein
VATTNNVAQLSAKLAKLGDACGKASKVAVSAGALRAKKVIEAERAKAVPSGRLRNVGKSGGKLGVRYTLIGGDLKPVAIVRATGPWQIIEGDTKRHTIGPKGTRRRAASGRRAVRMPDGSFRRTVVHPGTKGKHPFRKGVEKANVPVGKAMREAAIKNVLGAIK